MEAEGSKKARVYEVDELLKNLKLSEAEREGVFLAKEDRESLPEVKWMAVGRLLTVRGFSEQSLEKTLRAAWNPAREVSFRSIEQNLFQVQAHCVGDWNRIMEDGPWLFRECAFMVEKFYGATPTPSVLPNRVQAWIQIHRIPPMYRTEAILKQLAARVGEVDRVEAKVVSFGNGYFHRARVKLTADKPLPRVVTFTPEGCESMMFVVMYEKLPKFCNFCGKMGHEHMECGTGEYAGTDLQFGNWMLASEASWHPSTPRVHWEKRRQESPSYELWTGWEGLGGKSSFEKMPPWKRNSGEAGLDNGKGNALEDSATSPLKPLLEGVEKSADKTGAQRHLNLNDVDLALVAIPLPPP
ncbi:uncharacterized protein [Lolium perenne]|uniref:uncharacterized protein n=1 Tax=Lolium perenne TaxID=4522 RepID=UPI0021F5ED6A|nr:uncharacterized protein LOC127339154 [Lolium perenne]